MVAENTAACSVDGAPGSAIQTAGGRAGFKYIAKNILVLFRNLFCMNP